MKKAFFGAFLAVTGIQGFSATVIETESFNSYFVNLEDDASTQIEVKTETYVSTRPNSIINIRKVTDELYVVTQQYLAHTMEIRIGDKLVERVDSATIKLIKERSKYVTIIAPSNLDVSIKEIPRFTCMAYWSGFVVNTESGKCEARGQSGCGNPFEFKTLEECTGSLKLN